MLHCQSLSKIFQVVSIGSCCELPLSNMLSSSLSVIKLHRVVSVPLVECSPSRRSMDPQETAGLQPQAFETENICLP